MCFQTLKKATYIINNIDIYIFNIKFDLVE